MTSSATTDLSQELGRYTVDTDSSEVIDSQHTPDHVKEEPSEIMITGELSRFNTLQDNKDSIIKYECLDLSVNKHNSGLIIKEQVLEQSVKEEQFEAKDKGNSEPNAMGTPARYGIDAMLHRPDSTATLPQGPTVTGFDSRVWSTTLLPGGTDFGLYPERSSETVGTCGKETDLISSMRESCGKEQYDIEAVRREGQIYYRTVTDIQSRTDKEQYNIEAVRRGGQVYYRPVTDTQPRTELVVCTASHGKDANVVKADNTESSSDWNIRFGESSAPCIEIPGGGKTHQCQESCELNSPDTPHKYNNGKEHMCYICGECFSLKDTLIEHQLTHSWGNPDKEFSAKDELNHTEEPHKCDLCGKCFTFKGNLKRHQLLHSGELPFICTVCSRGFVQKSYLREHELIHTGERPHECTLCGRSFLKKSNLNKHYLIHIGDKPHKCDVCGKCFFDKGTLNKHHLVHTGEKPHKCPVCGTCFSQSSTLKKHQLMHTGEKPQECQICGKRFLEKSTLKKHHLIHTGEKPHKCSACGKGFSQRPSLVKHQQRALEALTSRKLGRGVCTAVQLEPHEPLDTYREEEPSQALTEETSD